MGKKFSSNAKVSLTEQNNNMIGQQSISQAFTDGNYGENYFFHPRYIFASRPRIAWAVKKFQNQRAVF